MPFIFYKNSLIDFPFTLGVAINLIVPGPQCAQILIGIIPLITSLFSFNDSSKT